MKKLFCVFLIFLFTTGCKSKLENIKPIKNNISFDCSVTFYNETYECKVTNTKDTNFNLKFTFPESINGLEYTIKNGTISSTYKGIEYKTSIEDYPPQNLANFIYSVLSVVSFAEKRRADTHQSGARCNGGLQAVRHAHRKNRHIYIMQFFL